MLQQKKDLTAYPKHQTSRICGGACVDQQTISSLQPCETDDAVRSRVDQVVSNKLPIAYLARHGEMTWSLSAQHTGLTDLPLTERGKRNARALGERLNGMALGARADRVLSRIREVEGDVLLFSSGHFPRVLAAHWLGFDPSAGKYFLLSTASLSALRY